MNDKLVESAMAGRVSRRLGPIPGSNPLLQRAILKHSRSRVSATLSPFGRGLGNLGAAPVSDRGTLGGLTQFLTQFDVSGSATGP
jgi:hypothetical protein